MTFDILVQAHIGAFIAFGTASILGRFIRSARSVARSERSQVVNDEPIGRNMDEVARIVEALQFFESHGQVCPAGWNKGDAGMKNTPDGVAEYLTEHGEAL